MGGKGCPVAQAIEIAEEHQPGGCMRVGEPGQEEPPEQAGQHPHRQQDAGSTGHPARVVERYPAARHDHVEMRMWVIAEPQLWSTAVAPMRAPRCLGSAAIVSSVSAAVRNSRS